jgi:hypothetical protein
MTNRGLQIELPIMALELELSEVNIPIDIDWRDWKLVGAILACRPRRVRKPQTVQEVLDVDDLRQQELEELQQLLVIPLICIDPSRSQYIRFAQLGQSCFVRAEASCLQRQTIYIKELTNWMSAKAESSLGTYDKFDGFLIRRRDPIVFKYQCKSTPAGYFDDVTQVVRRPAHGDRSWEVKLHFTKKSKGLEGLIPTAFNVILGYSERKGGQYCRIDTVLSLNITDVSTDKTSDTGGGVKVSLIDQPLRLASGDHFTVVDIEFEPGLIRKLYGLFGGIWQNVAEYSKTNQHKRIRRNVESDGSKTSHIWQKVTKTVEAGEYKGGRIWHKMTETANVRK